MYLMVIPLFFASIIDSLIDSSSINDIDEDNYSSLYNYRPLSLYYQTIVIVI